MIEITRSKICLGIFFSIALFGVNHAEGMFNEQGQWICSKEIDIEVSYYETYTESFQNTIDKVYLTDGTKAAQLYFEFAIKEEGFGQDWKRAQECLIQSGIDITKLSPIVIPEEQKPDEFKPMIKPTEEDMNKSVPLEKIPPIEKFEPEPTDSSYYIGTVLIPIIAIGGFAFFVLRSRKRHVDSKTTSKDYNNSDETRDEPNQNIEIEIQGGIEK